MACRLCLKEVPVVRSHIIPEFCFASMYDQDHRFIEVHDVDAGKVRRGQKGFWERLLCSDCETRLNRFERHARRLFKDKLPERKSLRRIDVPNLDYRLFKLFILSVLWRASVSSHPVFEHVSLGKHEEIMRGMVVAAKSRTTRSVW